MRKWFSAAAAAVMAFSVLCACGGGTEAVTVPPETAYECTVINSFEDWGEDIDPIVLYNRLGRIEQTEDTTKVTDGSKAIAVTPVLAGEFEKDLAIMPSENINRLGLPGFSQRLVVTRAGMNQSDFTAVRRILLDAYSEYAAETTLRVYVDFGDQSIWETFVLQPDTWTTIDFVLDPAQTVGLDLTDATYIRFEFEVTDGSQTVYLDNLRLLRGQPVSSAAPVFADGVFLDFADPMHSSLVFPFTAQYYFESPMPDMTITGEYAVSAADGGSALRITAPGISADNRFAGRNTSHYAGVEIRQTTLEANGFTAMRGEDRFSFRLYNDAPMTQLVCVEVHKSDGAFFSEYRRLAAQETYLFDKTFAELNAGLGAGNTEQQGTGSATKVVIKWLLSVGDGAFELYDMRLTEAQA